MGLELGSVHQTKNGGTVKVLRLGSDNLGRVSGDLFYCEWTPSGELGYLNGDGYSVNCNGRLAGTKAGPRESGNDIVGTADLNVTFTPGRYTKPYRRVKQPTLAKSR